MADVKQGTGYGRVWVERGPRSRHGDLAAAALTLTRATDIEHILEAATHAAQDIIGTHQAVTSRLVHGWEGASTFVALSDRYAEYRDYDHPPAGRGVLNYVTRENRPLRLTGEQLVEHPEWRGLRDAPGHPPLPNYLAAPLVARNGGNLGLIQLSDKVDGSEFSEDDEGMLVQIAQMASAAIENIELYEAERRERLVAEALYAVGQAISRGRDLHEIVQEVTDACTRLSTARFGAFFYNRVEASGEQLLLYTLSGAPRSAFEHFGHPRATAIFKPTFDGTRVMRVDDVTRHPDYGKNAPLRGMPEGHLPVRSYLAIPVKLSDDSVAGGLFFGHPDPGVFTEEHERLVLGVAAHAAIAIENVRLFDRERWARQEAEDRAQAALSLQYVADGVFLVDAGGTVRVWNPAAERITGRKATEVLGQPVEATIPDWQLLEPRIPTATAAGEEGPGDVEVPREAAAAVGASPDGARVLPVALDGEERWISIHGVAFGEGTVYAFRDVTSERRLEQIRADMIATVSHELRTPLASVYGAARTLQREDVEIPEDVRDRLIGMVATECERLNRIVDEFLLASSLDRTASFVQEAVDVRAVAADALHAAQARSPEGVSLQLVGDEGVGCAAADDAKLRQVMMNLVDNALKYGSAGGRVEIGVAEEDRTVKLWVRDYGPGIPADEQERIFERFYRLDPQQLRGVSGTGLGLYICRELVSRMGGRLTLSSRPGESTTFTVELPLASTAA